MVDRNSMERLFPEIRLSDDYQICALDKDGSPCFSIRGSASPAIDLQLLFGLSYSDKTADFKDKGRSISAVPVSYTHLDVYKRQGSYRSGDMY